MIVGLPGGVVTLELSDAVERASNRRSLAGNAYTHLILFLVGIREPCSWMQPAAQVQG